MDKGLPTRAVSASLRRWDCGWNDQRLGWRNPAYLVGTRRLVRSAGTGRTYSIKMENSSVQSYGRGRGPIHFISRRVISWMWNMPLNLCWIAAPDIAFPNRRDIKWI